MKRQVIIFSLIVTSITACGQREKNSAQQNDKSVGGPCEGCEAVYEYGNRTLTSIDTLPGFEGPGVKLIVAGKILKPDGHNPAEGVIVYIYHTNSEGIYPTRRNEAGWARRHGYLRGWVKTDAQGNYRFYTRRPGAYPGRQNPEHIHVTIKEAGYAPYYVDEFLFDDDPILTADHRARQEQRGGNGIVIPEKLQDGNLIVYRNIILGRNIDGYE